MTRTSRSGPPTSHSSPAGPDAMVRAWVSGARPRTLPAALSPVVVGTAVAALQGRVIPARALLAVVVALALQVGTNYANDYSDGIRGTDVSRVGPARLVASGVFSPRSVLVAAAVAFAVAAAAGLVLAALAGWWLVVVGALCIAAGWLYTGGPRPYGYTGFGEVSVFVFFGVVATVGSAYVHLERITALAVFASLPVGLIATALLVVNNLRDIPTDAAAGKQTLAVRIGDARTRRLYAVLVVVGAASPVFVASAFRLPWAALGVAGVPLAAQLAAVVGAGTRDRELIAVLAGTARLQLVVSVLFAAGLALS